MNLFDVCVWTSFLVSFLLVSFVFIFFLMYISNSVVKFKYLYYFSTCLLLIKNQLFFCFSHFCSAYCNWTLFFLCMCVPELGLTETIKTRNVLLPLGRKQRCDFIVLFTLLTLCTLIIAMICCLQLNTFRWHAG